MILPFSTQLNGKPTYFVEKIHKGLSILNVALDPKEHYPNNYNFKLKDKFQPKIHTIREDKNNRWEKGVMIDFFINSRTKDMFRFAPSLPVKSVQDIYMSYAFDNIIEITIGGRYIYDFKEKEQLAVNDGFDNYEAFFDFFYPIITSKPNNFFSGKIIYWTDFKY
ncbi:hypothetical protein JSO59_001210 [Riemerella anatipestifer]|uniref:hypothetical protein n=1 Tax=Riemerella anatipestifer TaxID=34085 RepID=UPI0030C5D52E